MPPKTPCRFQHSPEGCRHGATCRFLHTRTSPSCARGKIDTRSLSGPLYALDVECVATGWGCKDRAAARVAVVNADLEAVWTTYIQPTEGIVSCLTALTGILPQQLVNAPDLGTAKMQLRQVMPTNCILIGQGIQSDIAWLGLERGVDFAEAFDVAHLFRIARPIDGQFRVFSLRHVVLHLMGEDMQVGEHNPIVDAQYAMAVFHRYRYLHENEGYWKSVQDTLKRNPITPSFSQTHPFLDGVAMSWQAEQQRKQQHDKATATSQ